MQIDKSPFFRKAFIPWYATDTACLVKALVMFALALFGADGIKIARQVAAYHDYIWVPSLLLVLSIIVLMINVTRVITRYTGKSAMR